MAIQQMYLGVGASKKTYLDDVFSTYLYKGTSNTAQTITTGLDLATEGGLVWLKKRTDGQEHSLNDTARGAGYLLDSNSSSGSYSSAGDTLASFTSTGFTLPSAWAPRVNSNGDYASWSFKKTPGFFDIVTWSGDSATSRTISHNLGCIPGMIVIKKTGGGTSDWVVYHRSVGNTKALYLNATNYAYTGTYWFNDTSPTADEFTIGNIHLVNGSGNTYIAYLFAGGESTAATARSVDFDGTGDYLLSGSSSDYTFGTGDFTVEGWVKLNDTNNRGIFQISTASTGYASYSNSVGFSYMGSRWDIYGANNTQMPATANNNLQHSLGQWIHFAYSRSSGTSRVFVNGFLLKEFSDTTDYTGSYLAIGSYKASGYELNGSISNFRVVKGTAVYTSSFRPPTEPLTNITNTKLLCCNDSSTTGSTVTPGTITANGDPTASTDSPFDDPAAFTFGENGDQSIVKTGSYTGNGSTTGPEINLGFEPSWVIVKRATGGSGGWSIWDSMRGMTTGSNDKVLFSDANDAEASYDYLDLTSTGFKLKVDYSFLNNSGDTYIYTAIRRSDGYCGKPIEDPTKCFAMDTGAGSSTIPNYDSGFPVDFGLKKAPDVSDSSWLTGSRLIGTNYLLTNSSAYETTLSGNTWDSNLGWMADSSQGSTHMAWMWKRHAGFDVLNYNITSASGQITIPHSLGRAPEMIWQKHRTTDDSWIVYHKDLTANHWVLLDGNNAETNGGTGYWGTSSPTSSHFEIKGSSRYTGNHLFMLFASVDGISSVGSYSGSNSSQTISTGFAPRFLVMKKIDTAQGWVVLDTVRGWGSGNDERLEFHNSSAQNDNIDFGAPTSSGFTLVGNVEKSNQSGGSYIYYAHA